MLRLVARADVLLEGFRPGVAERLGVGPDDCHARNPRLVYGRMTGWGQDGPLARGPGHDINYLALTGALHAIGRAGDRPVVPLNLVADLGGGSMLLLVGVLAALWDARRSGRGQVVDAAMVDGASLLMQMIWALRGRGLWADGRETNLLDGGAPYYDTYTCADGRYVAVGALEPQFYAQLLDGLGLDPAACPAERPRGLADAAHAVHRGLHHPHAGRVGAAFDGTDACVTPVLALDEVAKIRMSSRGARSSRRRHAPGRPGAPVLPHPADTARGAPRAGRRGRRARRLGSRRPASTQRSAAESQTDNTAFADRRPAAALEARGKSVRPTERRPPAGCGCGSGRPGCRGPSSWRR